MGLRDLKGRAEKISARIQDEISSAIHEAERERHDSVLLGLFELRRECGDAIPVEAIVRFMNREFSRQYNSRNIYVYRGDAEKRARKRSQEAVKCPSS